MVIKLKRNESFYIREGWFEKAINVIQENKGTNIFLKNDGVKYLGIGSNMVKGLKYWLRAAKIIEGNENHLSDTGEILYKDDPYLDKKFSWFIIHYNLAANREDCPIFNEVFNSSFQSFKKSELAEILNETFELEDPTVKMKYIEQDLGVFLKSYVTEEVIKNPEDNYACPLASLKLLTKSKEGYKKHSPQYNTLSPFVIYYALMNVYPDDEQDHFDIEESAEAVNSPVKLFNLDKYMYLQYLEELRKAQLITINKTAGLNTVYFEKRCELGDLYQMENDR